MDTVRVAFFADLHIRRNKMQSQTDLGAPSRVIARKAQAALNDVEPDVVFGLGDLTAESAPEDWEGYRRWVEGVDAPVFDLLGNHDRDYTLFSRHQYAREYFEVLGRVSGTKALAVGNTVFILVSEEHNPEGTANRLTSTVPFKRFQFIEEVLRRYAGDSNVFILSHTLLRGTTALSDKWSFNDTRAWTVITRRFFDLFERYPVVAHLTGHTHIDYRYRARVTDIDGNPRVRKVGKFVDGREWPDLPDVYFLNMPCVDTAHGWFGSNFALLRELGKSTAKARKSPFRRLFMMVEEKGPPFFDLVYRSAINNVLGRAAIYYVDLVPGEDRVTVTTRWLRKNRDMEHHPIDLNVPVRLDDREVRHLASDLSIRTKRNLDIVRDDWFVVPSGEEGSAVLSQRFNKPLVVQGLRVDADGLNGHRAAWKGSRDGGATWGGAWQQDPRALGPVDAVMVRVAFEASNGPAAVRDVVVETAD